MIAMEKHDSPSRPKRLPVMMCVAVVNFLFLGGVIRLKETQMQLPIVNGNYQSEEEILWISTLQIIDKVETTE
jgi:hypothetical protein